MDALLPVDLIEKPAELPLGIPKVVILRRDTPSAPLPHDAGAVHVLSSLNLATAGKHDDRAAAPLADLPDAAAAATHYHLSQWALAVQGFERAITLYRRGGPPGEALAARALAQLGRRFQRRGHHAEAEPQ